jgi:hypothetical protein
MAVMTDMAGVDMHRTNGVINLDPQGAISLGAGVDVEDLGHEIILTRHPRKVTCDLTALIGSPDGRTWPLLPILRHLAALHYGQKVPVSEFDALVAADQASELNRDGSVITMPRSIAALTPSMFEEPNA